MAKSRTVTFTESEIKTLIDMLEGGFYYAQERVADSTSWLNSLEEIEEEKTYVRNMLNMSRTLNPKKYNELLTDENVVFLQKELLTRDSKEILKEVEEAEAERRAAWEQWGK